MMWQEVLGPGSVWEDHEERDSFHFLHNTVQTHPFDERTKTIQQYADDTRLFITPLSQKRVVIIDLLTAVLAILTGGGFGRQCQVTVGNKEIYLEDVEALEFLWKKDDKRTEEVDGHNDDREREPNLC